MGTNCGGEPYHPARQDGPIIDGLLTSLRATLMAFAQICCEPSNQIFKRQTDHDRASYVIHAFDIHEMLLDVIRRAREIIPFDSGGLIPYDPIKQTLVPTPDLYLSDGVNTLVPIRLGMGVIGQVAQKRKPELVNDMENDPRRQYLDTRSRSELAVPVLLEDKLLGV